MGWKQWWKIELVTLATKLGWRQWHWLGNWAGCSAGVVSEVGNWARCSGGVSGWGTRQVSGVGNWGGDSGKGTGLEEVAVA